jgi:hypothetical protein
MRKRDQRMRLASAKRGLQPIDGRSHVVPREAQQRVSKDEFDPLGRRSPIAEKLLGVGVEVVYTAAPTPIMGDHLRKARGEYLRIEAALENAVARSAAVDDCAHVPLPCHVRLSRLWGRCRWFISRSD